jgi:hypothetical protein
VLDEIPVTQRTTKRPIAQLEALGHTVTLQQAVAA